MIAQNTIRQFISTLTLEDMNDTEIMTDGTIYIDDCLYICDLLYINYNIHINPVHAYWLWLTFSRAWNAGWLNVNTINLETALDVIDKQLNAVKI